MDMLDFVLDKFNDLNFSLASKVHCIEYHFRDFAFQHTQLCVENGFRNKKGVLCLQLYYQVCTHNYTLNRSMVIF